MRVGTLGLCLIFGAMLSAGAGADDDAKAAKERAKACDQQAAVYQLEGDKYKAFMKTCLASQGPVTAIDEPLSPAEKEKRCAALANSKTLAGEERDKFVQDCIAAK
jgi:psiF repeat